MSAVIQTYLPGDFGGDALAAVLKGDVNPSGRLPYTYPAYPNSTVVYYHKPSEEQTPIEGVYKYESDYNLQYTFGFGLSYTTFTYSNLSLSKSDLIYENDSLKVSVEVKNSGTLAGKEVVQLYTSDIIASVTPDSKRLRKFKKIFLNPGETKKIEFTLKPEDVAFVNTQNKLVAEPGAFTVTIANQQKEFRLNKN
jgi:beta-glucosidase